MARINKKGRGFGLAVAGSRQFIRAKEAWQQECEASLQMGRKQREQEGGEARLERLESLPQQWTPARLHLLNVP